MNLNLLNHWQQQVFAAALLQRMLPNYAYFSEATQFGEHQLLVNQMDIIWQKLCLMPIKFNVEIQLDKLQSNIPEPSAFDFFAVYPAIDVCSGLVSLFESFDEKETFCATDIGLLSLNSVKDYLILKYDQPVDNKSEQQLNDLVEADPLYLWELQTQQELFEMLLEAKESKSNAQKVKNFVFEQKLSNLAIEY